MIKLDTGTIRQQGIKARHMEPGKLYCRLDDHDTTVADYLYLRQIGEEGSDREVAVFRNNGHVGTYSTERLNHLYFIKDPDSGVALLLGKPPESLVGELAIAIADAIGSVRVSDSDRGRIRAAIRKVLQGEG